MLELTLHAPGDAALLSATSVLAPGAPGSASNASASLLARSRRPAILTYNSPIVGAAKTLSGLPWHVMGWRRESVVLAVRMFEGVEFARGGRNVPGFVRVVVLAEEKMQFYEVGVEIVARFAGLRYVSLVFFWVVWWRGGKSGGVG